MASSSWVAELPGVDAGLELAFLHKWDVSGQVTHYHVVLFRDFLEDYGNDDIFCRPITWQPKLFSIKPLFAKVII